jgi:hypothetical protein
MSRGTVLNAWREELYRKGVLDRDAKSPREEFKRVRQQLQARGRIGVNGDPCLESLNCWAFPRRSSAQVATISIVT